MKPAALVQHVAWASLLGAPDALAWQKPGDLRPNDPAACPYCRAEPELMAKAGLVSHGGFDFGKTNTAKVDAELPANDIRWIESAHCEIGFALPPIKVTVEEKDKVRAELARLALVMPDVPAKPAVLDPWLRAHLYAQRCEDHRRQVS